MANRGDPMTIFNGTMARGAAGESEMTTDATVNYVPVEQARTMPGLRVAFTRGVPGAWSVAIKAIFDIKGIDYIAVPQEPGQENEPLRAWTGQTSAPVLMYHDDKPRIGWAEKLVLAEQLQPEPRLLPADQDERIAVMGFCHEICGEDGLGWNARLMLLSGERGPRDQDDGNSLMRKKYVSPVTNDYARKRVLAILDSMVRRLEAQAARGQPYFFGDRLTAADIYWPSFSNLFAPMSADLCTMPDYFRGIGPLLEIYLEQPVPRILLDHRDYIVRTYFRTPIAL
ncbi:glutathione S-transferase C-terminal domain-containing protein [Sphingobium sp. AN641]|uniref:glutathione S-transferase family protein n=1 Tax=Sphingobium sp. AN641 TaxID=3133443 RepID=UPI0030BB1CFA